MRRDQTAGNRTYYAANRAAELARVRRRQDARRVFLRLLRQQPCADCGAEYLPHQMDFDHRDPSRKSFRLTSGRAMLASPAAIRDEVAKCDIVCANCHRIRTQRQHAARLEERQASQDPATRRKRATWRSHAQALDRLRDVPCADCGIRLPPCAMDFDHRVPETKRAGVTRLVGRAGWSTILTEVARCDIVCANCHRDRTFRRRAGRSSGRE